MSLANKVVKKGFQGQILYNTGASYASPTWSLMSGGVSDCKVLAEWDKIDVTIRAAGGLKAEEPVLLALAIEGKVRTDESDTNGFVAMENAFLGKTVLDVLVLDGDPATTGVRGYRFDAKVTSFGEGQNPGDVLFRDFRIAPCIPQNGNPQKAVVSAGAPTFTAISAAA